MKNNNLKDIVKEELRNNFSVFTCSDKNCEIIAQSIIDKLGLVEVASGKIKANFIGNVEMYLHNTEIRNCTIFIRENKESKEG